MKKAFKITANNQYVQQVALPADIYTYQCNVLNPTDTYTFGLLTKSGVWNYYEVEVTKDVWAHRAKLEFKTEEAVTAFSLCSANASVANPVYVQNPILAERAEFSGIATKSLEEYVSELESGLVAENCTATLASGVLSISDATADKGKVTLSIIEESSVISTQVFFEKGLTPSQSAKLEAISKGMTEIDGGYIQSNLVELGNPEEALITAGLSGIDKDSTGIVPDGKMPAFWAGGTYEEATSSTAKAIIRHDGSVKFTEAEVEGIINALGGTIGDLAVEPSGRIAMYIPNTTESRLTFRADDIPALQSLLSTTVYGGDFTAGAGELAIPQTGTSTQTLTGSTYISQTGSTIEITGGRLLTLTCDFQGIGNASVGATLYLMRGSVKVRTLASAFVFGGGHQTDVGVVESITLEGMPSGTYTLMLEVSKVGTQLTSGNATVGSGVKVEWNFNREGVRNFLFGLNGFLSFFSNNHIYFTEEKGLDVRGKTNMPGLLGSASVIDGQLSNEWGRITSIATYTGGYRVTISNMEHANYTVQITSHTTNQWRIGTKTTSNFIILGTGDCDIAIMGNNY